MKTVATILCLLAFAKATASLDYSKDPSGWNELFDTESHAHIDGVDPSGWNYDRENKHSRRNNNKDKMKPGSMFGENALKNEDSETNPVVESEMAAAVKSNYDCGNKNSLRINNQDNMKQVSMFCENALKNEDSETNPVTESEMAAAAVKSKFFFSKESIAKENVAFVKRFISILLNTADLSDKYMEEGPDVSGVVEIRMSAERLKTLIEFSNSTKNISLREVDSILTASIYRKQIPIFGLPELIDKIFFMASQKEMWLPVFVIILIPFIYHLFVTSKTVTRFVTMLLLVIFIASYLVEYYRMYKEAEIHQRILLDKHPEMPSSCHRNEHSWLTSLLKSLERSVSFKKEDECEKYYKAVLLDPLVEVSPSRVLSSILSEFVLYPVNKLGGAISAFSTAVLGELPFYAGWIVWFGASTSIFMLTALALVMLFGGSVQLRGLFSGFSISSNQAPHTETPPAAPSVTAAPLHTSTSQPLLEAVSGMSNFVLMDANSLGTLLRAQSSVALHSGVQELTDTLKNTVTTQPSKEKIDLNELWKERSFAIFGKDELANTGCESSNVDQKVSSKDIDPEVKKDCEQKSSDTPEDKEELIGIYEVIQSNTVLSPLEATITETDSVSEEIENIATQDSRN